MTLHHIQARRDRELKSRLMEDKGVKLAQKKLDEQTSGYGFYGRRRLLTGALRIRRGMAPSIASVVDACRETLGFRGDLEIYVKPDPTFGAFVMKSPAGPLALCLTSRIVEGFSPAELRFVVGHEIGHLVFDHVSFPMPALAAIEDLAGPIVSRMTAIDLYLWCRSAEISADRAGLVCAQDINAAASSFMKLASGLSDASVIGDLNHYMSQVDSLASAPVARQKPRDDDDTLECFNTHPYSPLRLRALVAWARSDGYEQALGRSGLGSHMTAEQAEEIVERDLDLMQPSYLEEKTDEAENLRRVLFCAGMKVAAADGNVDDREKRALLALLGSDALWGNPDVKALAVELEEKLETVKDVPLFRRIQVVQHLTIIAGADGVVDEREVDVMSQVAVRLGVPPSIIDETLRAAAAPLD